MRDLRGLKEFIRILEDQGELLRITNPLDPRYEIAHVISEIGKREGPALLFEQVKGHSIAVAGNLLGSWSRLALALGVEEEVLRQGAIPNMEKRIPPVSLKEPVRRRVVAAGEGIDFLKKLPVLTHYLKDSGPYVTAGLTSARDPVGGAFGRGLHRMEVRGGGELGISLLNPPLSEIYALCRRENRKMEVATAIGVDPALLIAAVLKIPRGTDKLAAAGGLIGQAVETQRAETVDVEIPAYADIIIEGVIDPAGDEKDGTLGEASGYYMTFSKSPTVHVTAISFREDPCFQAIMPWSLEVDNLLTLVHGNNFIPKMKKEVPSLLDIRFVPGTFGAHAVMSIANDQKGEIRRALTLALSFTNIKKAIIVDEDIDPGDPMEVEWALCTRFQADRDLIFIPSVGGQPIDPSSGPGFATAKIGLDATRPEKEGFEKVDFPGEVKERTIPLINELRKKA